MDRDLDLSLLRTFSTIASTGSFTATGRKLLRTQSAISLRLRRLEDMIGAPLMIRTPEGISLTREGSLLLGFARRMLALNDEAIHRLEQEGARDSINVGIPEEYQNVYLDHALETFAAEYPAAAVTLDVQISQDLEHRLRQGLFDMIVSVHTQEETYRVQGRTIPVVWVSAATASWDSGQPIRLVLPPDGNLYQRIALAALETAELDWTIGYSPTTWSMTKSAVLAGAGITVASVDMIEAGMRPIGREVGLPRLPDMVVSLRRSAETASAAAMRLSELLSASLHAPPVVKE